MFNLVKKITAVFKAVLRLPFLLGAKCRSLFAAGALSLSASSAFGAIASDATDALATSVTDVGVAGLAVLLVIIAIMGFKWLQATII